MRASFRYAKQIFQERNGLLRYSQAKEQGINPKTLYQMVDAGLLVKEGRGIYRLASLPPLSNPDLVQVALRAPESVVCLISALSFHNLTTQVPYQIYIAILQNTKKPRIDYPPIEVIKLSKKVFRTGIEVHILDGVKVRIYGKEKTVADCFKFRNKIGKDIAIEALKGYVRDPERDIEILLRFARIDRVENVIRPYLEAIL